MTQNPRPAEGADGAPERRPGYGVNLAICLPRDALSVPVIRHLVRYALERVGVVETVIADIEVALTEACANVLHHSGPGDAYDVSVAIGPEICELRVVDVGHGFDHTSVQSRTGTHDLDAERGRGLQLMHALVDHIELVSAPEEGTLVHLVKKLAFDDDAPVRRLLFQALQRRQPPTAPTESSPGSSPATPTEGPGAVEATSDTD